MPSNYEGTPVYPTSFQLADDGVPPTASEVNVGLEALADRTAWLKDYTEGALTRLVKRAAALTAVQNFIPADQGSRLYGAADSMWCNCIGASATRFVASLERDGLGVTKVCISTDGYGWKEMGQLATAPGVGPRAIGILDVPSGIVNDCYIVLGGSYDDNTESPGKWIRVMRPGAAGFSDATTTALASNTNYGACVFAGSRCFLFGGTVNAAGSAKVATFEAKIVSADQADNYATWTNPTGGIFAGGNELQLADRWDVAAIGNIVCAFPIDFSYRSTYVTIDAPSNAVTTRTFAGGNARNVGLCAWRGLFWRACSRQADAGNILSIYSSPDGVTWTLKTQLTAKSGRGLMTSGDMLLLVSKPEATLGATTSSPMSLYASFDGTTFVPLAATFNVGNLADHTVCSTAERAAFMTRRGVLVSQDRTNLRINLGGLAL